MTAAPSILLLGASGQVGAELRQSFDGLGRLTVLDRSQLRLEREADIRRAIRAAAPGIILNAAACTAVDKAESETGTAMAINAHAPRVLAEEARRANALFVHYSTDYVFDGTKPSPWIETDSPNPLNVYGASKLAGEQAVIETGGRFLIFRTSWVYGPRGHNFLLTMLRLAGQRDRLSVVDDQIGSPTSSIEIARKTRAVVDAILKAPEGSAGSWAGIYHMTCSGSVSWCGFAEAIFARAGTRAGFRAPQLTPIPSSGYATPARRPLNSVLSCDKLAARFGVRLPRWEAALDEVFERLATADASAHL